MCRLARARSLGGQSPGPLLPSAIHWGLTLLGTWHGLGCPGRRHPQGRLYSRFRGGAHAHTGRGEAVGVAVEVGVGGTNRTERSHSDGRGLEAKWLGRGDVHVLGPPPVWGPGPGLGLSSASLIHVDTCVALSTHRATCSQTPGFPLTGLVASGCSQCILTGSPQGACGAGAWVRGRLQHGGSAGHLRHLIWSAQLPFSCSSGFLVSHQIARRAESGAGWACGPPVCLSGACWSAWACDGVHALGTVPLRSPGALGVTCRSGWATSWRRCSVAWEPGLWVP